MPFQQEPSSQRIPYEHVCQVAGRLFLESQFEVERLQSVLHDIQMKLQASEQKIRELEAMLREAESHGHR